MYKHSETVFNQIFSLIKGQLNSLIGQLENNGRMFNYESLFKILLFAQTSGKESLRDIETGLQANESKLYHIGLKSFARSTISYWNNKDNDNIFEKLFYEIYEKYNDTIGKRGDSLGISCIAMDSSFIGLSLSLFDWAKYRTSKGGIRIHVGLNIANYMPRFCVISNGKKGDNKIAKKIVKEGKLNKGEMIVFDRYYIDYDLREIIDDKKSYFVSRTKKNSKFKVINLYDKKGEGITYDAKVKLNGKQGKEKYKKYLRIVRFYNKDDQKEYEYITNNFDLSALQIADIYKNRRQIETFFRRIKQNLKIKTFFGTSENAVKNQIWIALIYYVLLKYLTDSVKLGKQQVLKFVRLISDKIFERILIFELYVICKSKKHCCMSTPKFKPPPNSLFSKI